MDNKTTFRFVGSLILEMPNMVIDAQNMARGDVISWINASIKVVDSIGGIVKLSLDKKNTKLLQGKIDDFEKNENEFQNQLEEELHIKKIKEIEKIKKDFENKRKILSNKFQTNQTSIYNNVIEEKQQLTLVMSEARDKLKKIIDIYENELSNLRSSDEYSSKEKKHFEECKRLLLLQYNKNIDI